MSRPAEAGEQRPGEQERGADALGQRRRPPSVLRDLVGSGARPRCRRATRPARRGARAARASPPRRGCAGRCAARPPRSVSSDGGERGQRGVLVAGGHDRPGEGRAAFDDELLHARVRPGAGIEAGGQGYRRPSARRFGLAARIPCRAWPTHARRSLGSWSRSGSQSDSLRKHLLGVEAAMRGLRAQVGRGRGALRRHRPAPRPRLRALPGPRHRPPAQGARAVRGEGLPAGADRRRGRARRPSWASRARPAWRRRSTRWTSCPASSPPARSCAPPASRA